MKCWNCGVNETDPAWGKLPFRSSCQACHAALHCCRNCVHYKPGLPNDCAIPGTDPITDRTATNFCEDFKLLGQGPSKAGDPSQAAKRLFGDDDGAPKAGDPKQRFDSLFHDDA